MASQRNTGAFVVGSVLGGLIGAAVTLWKTPRSGPELRAGLSGGKEIVTYRADSGTVTEERRFSNPVLSFVERAAAPIVGVELGKLARNDLNATAATPVRASAADARPPAATPARASAATTAGTEPQATGVAGTTPAASPYTSPATVQGDDTGVVNPDETATHNSSAGSTAHAATTEELTHPTGEYVEELGEKRADSGPGDTNASFPEPPSRA